MNPPVVIIPVKSGEKKSRLSGVLGRGQRERFAGLLLADALGALRGAGFLRSSYVVSSDESMLSLAARLGSRTVKEPEDMGVNSAVARGLDAVRGNPQVLVIPADLPLLRASELKHMARISGSGAEVAIAPSLAFDGTNALLFEKAINPALSYDRDSFWNHLEGFGGQGLRVAVCTEPGVMFDVDSPEDLRLLARSSSQRPSAEFARRVLG